jgi:hypothetical protein
VTGFQTGFNSQVDGVYDIFASIDGDPVKALYAIEPWCAAHPEAKFGNAVLNLADTLRANTK